jgi:hypothetical protein
MFHGLMNNSVFKSLYSFFRICGWKNRGSPYIGANSVVYNDASTPKVMKRQIKYDKIIMNIKSGLASENDVLSQHKSLPPCSPGTLVSK